MEKLKLNSETEPLSSGQGLMVLLNQFGLTKASQLNSENMTMSYV